MRLMSFDADLMAAKYYKTAAPQQNAPTTRLEMFYFLDDVSFLTYGHSFTEENSHAAPRPPECCSPIRLAPRRRNVMHALLKCHRHAMQASLALRQDIAPLSRFRGIIYYVISCDLPLHLLIDATC